MRAALTARRRPFHGLVALGLVGFLLWRTLAALWLLPGMVRLDGVAEGLGWSSERRLRQALVSAPLGDEASADETLALLALLAEHTAAHDVVVLLAPPEDARELGFLLSALAFPARDRARELGLRARARRSARACEHGGRPARARRARNAARVFLAAARAHGPP